MKLDSGTGCGPLSGDLEVDSVVGFNPITASFAMYDELRKLCASKSTVAFGWKGQLVAQAPCTKPLPEPTLSWQIQSEGGGWSSSSRP